MAVVRLSTTTRPSPCGSAGGLQHAHARQVPQRLRPPATRTYLPPGWTHWRVRWMGVYNYRSFAMNENGTARPLLRNPSDHVRDPRHGLSRKLCRARGAVLPASGVRGSPQRAPSRKTTRSRGGSRDALKTLGCAKEFRDVFRQLPLPRQAVDLRGEHVGQAVDDRWQIVRGGSSARPTNTARVVLSVDEAVNGVIDALEATGEDERPWSSSPRTTGT